MFTKEIFIRINFMALVVVMILMELRTKVNTSKVKDTGRDWRLSRFQVKLTVDNFSKEKDKVLVK
jgi:hypothetical protein